jgi:hypothetical protein
VDRSGPVRDRLQPYVRSQGLRHAIGFTTYSRFPDIPDRGKSRSRFAAKAAAADIATIRKDQLFSVAGRAAKTGGDLFSAVNLPGGEAHLVARSFTGVKERNERVLDRS